MFISSTVIWFVLALVMAGAEMFLGTVYLLVAFVAAAVAGIFAWSGFDLTGQLAAFGILVAVGAVYIRFFFRRDEETSEALQHMDTGHTVEVLEVGADGLTVVQYRGAPWVARPEEGTKLTPGIWKIVRVDGAQLVLCRSRNGII